jgi:hypothetical protein
MLVLFALALVGIMAMAGLLIDGGMAWANRREAQAAADTAALAAAQAAVNATDPTAAGQAIAATNGFPADLVDCSGVTQAGQGVVVNRPPSSGPNAGDDNFVEVVTTRAYHTTFAATVGQTCWLVSARAVASIGATSVAKCSFCSLNSSDKNHTLVLKNGATLRVDGDIVVNSSNQTNAPSTCTTGNKNLHDFHVCGDAFDIFGAGGSISAQTISVVGGWETHDQNIATADQKADPCPYSPDPPAQIEPSNVCIGATVIADPLNDPSNPKNAIDPPDASTLSIPAVGANGCSAVAGTSGVKLPTGTPGAPVTLTISSGNWTICPGLYHGGLSVTGGSVTMISGIYYMAGGGFSVSGTGSINGGSGVMIYNSSGTGAAQSTNPGTDLVPAGNKNLKNPTITGTLTGMGVTPVVNGGLTASPASPTTVGVAVTYTMALGKFTKAGASDPFPTGSVIFYDGSSVISTCGTNGVVTASVDPTNTFVRAKCTVTYGTWGTRAISATYCGFVNPCNGQTAIPNAAYNPIGDTLNMVISTPAGSLIKPISITGSGNVVLHGPTSGRYSGVTLYQNRTSNLQITVAPGSGAGACSGTWLTDGVPPNGNPVPHPCGALGGLQGTIYAANSDALVYITASGLANLQVISGMIQVDSNADARFAYTPQFFANGNVHLVE